MTDFKIDYRETNPQLHNLMVQNSCTSLSVIDKCSIEIAALSDTSMLGVLSVLRNERARLVREDAAYYCADLILREVYKNVKPEFVRDPDWEAEPEGDPV